MSSESGIYVFCAINETEPKSFGTVSLNGNENEIFTIHYKDTAMVVTRVEDDVLPNRNNLFAHQKTITEVMKQYTLIPMSFGNVFSSEEDVLLIVEHLYEEFEKLFSHLKNKMEVGLKVIAKKEWIEKEIENNPLLKEWKKGGKKTSNPAAFYEQIQLGEQAQNFVMNLQNKVVKEVYEPLLELAEAGKPNDIIPGKVVLNAAFLVDCEKEEAFDQRVNEIFELWKDKVEFKYTGPWPAYNFVNIRLRIEDGS